MPPITNPLPMQPYGDIRIEALHTHLTVHTTIIKETHKIAYALSDCRALSSSSSFLVVTSCAEWIHVKRNILSLGTYQAMSYGLTITVFCLIYITRPASVLLTFIMIHSDENETASDSNKLTFLHSSSIRIMISTIAYRLKHLSTPFDS